jgi:hypothetical protein
MTNGTQFPTTSDIPARSFLFPLYRSVYTLDCILFTIAQSDIWESIRISSPHVYKFVLRHWGRRQLGRLFVCILRFVVQL